MNIVYVCQNKLKCFNVKNMKPLTLFENGEDVSITAICHNQQITNGISLGLSDGKIKDFDLREKKVIRQAKLHPGSKVVAIASRGRLLVSASQDGRAIIYDCQSQQEVREIELA